MRRVLSSMWVGCGLLVPASGQSGSPPVVVQPDSLAGLREGRLLVGGVEADWPLVEPWTVETAADIGERLVATLQADGHLEARIDSIVRDPGADGSEAAAFYLDAGPRFETGTMLLRGVTLFDPDVLAGSFETRQGRPFRAAALERDFDRLLAGYDQRGHVLAQVRIAALSPSDSGTPYTLDLVIDVEEGERSLLAETRLEGARRTRAAFVNRLLGIRPGEPLPSYDPDEIRRRLDGTGLFDEVGEVSLSIDENDELILHLPVVESAPGVFDAVLGYLPPRTSGAGGSVVGNVNVQLRNVLGQGREFGFRFNRLPARVTRLDLRAGDPFVLGTPVSIDAGLEGYQRDSTFTQRRYRLETGYRIAEGLSLVATASREVTRPGADSLVNIPRSNAWFAGFGFRYRRVDRPLNPRTGWWLTVEAERGRKLRTLTSIRSDPTLSAASAVLRQQRIRLESRFFFPLAPRHVLAAGLEGRAVESEAYDESDLFRLGGARSLRGYGEEQFLGSLTGRTLLEWRYLLDATSHVFVFTDLGFLRQPAPSRLIRSDLGIVGAERAGELEWLPGYGFGMQFGTEAGVFSVSLALNPDEGFGANVHVGMLLGL